MPKYTVYLGRDTLKSHRFINRATILIGRSDEADIVLDNPAVSRKHAQVRKMGNHYVIEDLSGKAGVAVNGRPVQSQVLHEGDRIEIHKFTIRYEVPHDEAEQERRVAAGEPPIPDADETIGSIRRGPAPKPDAAGATFMVSPEDLAKVRESVQARQAAHLVVTDADGRRTVKLGGLDLVTVGKSQACEVRIKGGFFMAQRVALLSKEGKKWSIDFLGGWVVPVLGGAKLRKGEPRPLDDGDEITIGAAKIKFRDQM